MPQVATARGPVEAEDLGVTLVHEHLRLRRTAASSEFPRFVDERSEFASVIGDVDRAYAAGVRTICDPTVMGLGRDAEFVLKVVQNSPMNIVVATGLYADAVLPLPFQAMTAGELAEYFIRDITDGIQGTEMRAAFLKCMSEAAELTPDSKVMFNAIAQAHLATGVPIMTHSNPHSGSGRVQLDELEAAGVDPQRVLIGHSGDTADVEYLAAIAERGAYLGMDRFGLDDILSMDERIQTIIQLMDRGFGRQLLLSHDAVCVNDRVVTPVEIADRRSRWQMTHIFDDVIPRLLELGVPQTDVDVMLSTSVHTWLAPATT